MVKSNSAGKLIIALIIGGAVGNFYDRINYFAVPDFIDFHIQTYPLVYLQYSGYFYFYRNIFL